MSLQHINDMAKRENELRRHEAHKKGESYPPKTNIPWYLMLVPLLITALILGWIVFGFVQYLVNFILDFEVPKIISSNRRGLLIFCTSVLACIFYKILKNDRLLITVLEFIGGFVGLIFSIKEFPESSIEWVHIVSFGSTVFFFILGIKDLKSLNVMGQYKRGVFNMENLLLFLKEVFSRVSSLKG